MGETQLSEVVAQGKAMASPVTVRAVAAPSGQAPSAARVANVQAAANAALGVFSQVEAACTRFDPASPLMRANAGPDRWHGVTAVCYDALVEAYGAYRDTAGRFDPRVFGDLVRLGYGRSMAGTGAGTGTAVPRQTSAPGPPEGRPALPPWRPRFRDRDHAVMLGGRPVDLGGIGKGLAVRWAAQRLGQTCSDYLIEAGGDCYCAGQAPEGGLWRIAVEDPDGGPNPLAVLALTDRACATSSIRLRRWRAGGVEVHHLVNPRDGLPGGQDLQAVTVVHPDPATAEVWSKTLFLAGLAGVADLATSRELSALWIDRAGGLGMSRPMDRHVIWQAA